MIELSGRAKAELASAVAYLEQESPRAAEGLAAAVERTIDTLAEMPHRGRPGRIGGTRELIVRGAPYVVVYSVAGETISVLSIRHISRAGRT